MLFTGTVRYALEAMWAPGLAISHLCTVVVSIAPERDVALAGSCSLERLVLAGARPTRVSSS